MDNNQKNSAWPKLISLTISGLIEYLISIFLDKIIFVNAREVIASNPGLKIYRPGNNIDIYLYYLVSVVLFSMISYFILKYFNKRLQKVNKKLLAILLLITYLPFLFIISKFAPIPKVRDGTLIQGKAPANSYVYVFIEPLNGNGNFYIQEQPGQYHIPDNKNQWRVIGNFGGSPKLKLKYEIIAFSVYNPVKIDSTKIIFSIKELNKIFTGSDKFVRLVQQKKE